MFTRYLLLAGLALVVLPLAGFGLWLATLPAAPVTFAPPAIPLAETDAMLAALKPPKRARPLVAVVGINDATETTDYLMPVGILRRADIADVVTLSTEAGPVKLYPALTVEAEATIEAFDALHPEGADYVIVPAMSHDEDPLVTAWLRRQAEGGAVVVAVCAGAKIVAAAGLLDGRRATTHWYYLENLLKRHPSIRYVPDGRMVVDRGVATTTGITASMPMVLTLIEAIAGRGKAEAIAGDLGLGSWDSRHDSGAFRLTRPFAKTVLRNRLAFWSRDRFGIALEPGMDEVSLALVADAWSRTYRSSVELFAASSGAVTTRNGVRVLPDKIANTWPGQRLSVDEQPAKALDGALQEIAARHGRDTADVVAMQLEYPQRGSGP
ncbi:DJ-1/PfpI family protein [Shinella kummerowiae]|jgi:putative intracellular protease/amidase|uniref:Transcriptional regulator n=1 Tax=Shinella kummerowiae TaxID=417745 RepID=A0A6N8SJB6_9HYPH|nr:DJ-1/PfpI family protein [Shinella kummerowiae]MCT7664069.1 DJ-1/PfpI family protein [Shinella kummerowiae]MXN48563.1 transcriptional regulator [Shinella kummerowiae]